MERSKVLGPYGRTLCDAASFTLSSETIASLESPMIPKEEYIRNVNSR